MMNDNLSIQALIQDLTLILTIIPLVSLWIYFRPINGSSLKQSQIILRLSLFLSFTQACTLFYLIFFRSPMEIWLCAIIIFPTHIYLIKFFKTLPLRSLSKLNLHNPFFSNMVCLVLIAMSTVPYGIVFTYLCLSLFLFLSRFIDKDPILRFLNLRLIEPITSLAISFFFLSLNEQESIQMLGYFIFSSYAILRLHSIARYFFFPRTIKTSFWGNYDVFLSMTIFPQIFLLFSFSKCCIDGLTIGFTQQVLLSLISGGIILPLLNAFPKVIQKINHPHIHSNDNFTNTPGFYYWKKDKASLLKLVGDFLKKHYDVSQFFLILIKSPETKSKDISLRLLNAKKDLPFIVPSNAFTSVKRHFNNNLWLPENSTITKDFISNISNRLSLNDEINKPMVCVKINFEEELKYLLLVDRATLFTAHEKYHLTKDGKHLSRIIDQFLAYEKKQKLLMEQTQEAQDQLDLEAIRTKTMLLEGTLKESSDNQKNRINTEKVEALSKFSSSLDDEISNPLTNMMMALQINLEQLKKKGKLSPQSRDSLLHIIISQSLRIKEILGKNQELLTKQKLFSKKQSFLLDRDK